MRRNLVSILMFLILAYVVFSPLFPYDDFLSEYNATQNVSNCE